MNECWNLNPIYTGFDDPRFEEDLQALRRTVRDMEELTQHLTGDSAALLKRGLTLQEQLQELAEKLLCYAELRQAACTTDAEAGSKIGKIMGVYSDSAAPVAAFEGWLAAIPDLDSLIASDPLFEGHLPGRGN